MSKDSRGGNKMKEKLKGIFMGIIIGTMLAPTSYAIVDTITKELNYNNIKITLDGNEINPTDENGNYIEPFIIDGTTYLPVRGIANALALDVAWDGNTNTVILNTPNTDADYSVFNGYYTGGGVAIPDTEYTIGEWRADLSNVTKDSISLSFLQSESDFVIGLDLYRQSDGSYYGEGYSEWGYSRITVWLDSPERISLTVMGAASTPGTEWLYRK